MSNRDNSNNDDDNNDDDRDHDAVERDEHDRWRAVLPALSAPPDLAVRVLREHQRRTARPLPRRWRPMVLAAVSGALAASLLWTAPRWLPTAQPTGTIVADATARRIDVDGAAITLQPHSAIAFDDGVTLQAGEAFFRVAPHDARAPFVVTTPAGAIVVTGTCFSVVLEDSAMLAQHHPRSLAVGAAMGAALGVVVTVTVHEGSVRLRNPHGELVLQAGERGSLTAENAPEAATTALARADQRLAAVLSTVHATEAAVAGDARALIDENARLRALVDRRDEELALLDVERVEREGEPQPFPKDLPARFAEQALLSTLTTALKEAGVEGDITAIDCAEYPCMVWGEALIDTSELTRELGKSPAFAAYADDSKHVRGWGAGEGKRELFAITLMPKDPARSDQEKALLDRRLQARAQAAFEANKPASWSESK